MADGFVCYMGEELFKRKASKTLLRIEGCYQPFSVKK